MDEDVLNSVKEIVLKKPPGLPKSEKPEIIKWSGVEMCEKHSVKLLAHRLAELAHKTKYVQVNVIGASGFGKSELCYTLAHLIHQILDEDYGCQYGVRYMDRQFLDNVHEVVGEIGVPTIIVLNDISYAVPNILSRKFTKALAETPRYAQRVMMIMNYGFETAIPLQLRNAADARIYLSLSPEEWQPLLKIIGTRYKPMLRWFSNVSRIVRGEKTWVMKCGKRKIEYEWRKPFVLAMVIEDYRPRFIVSPLRTWVDQQCSICDPEYSKLQN